ASTGRREPRVDLRESAEAQRAGVRELEVTKTTRVRTEERGAVALDAILRADQEEVGLNRRGLQRRKERTTRPERTPPVLNRLELSRVQDDRLDHPRPAVSRAEEIHASVDRVAEQKRSRDEPRCVHVREGDQPVQPRGDRATLGTADLLERD